MKVRLTEQQIEYIKKNALNENYINSSPESIQLANQLFSDPNNRTLWRCFSSKFEEGIFKYGMTSEYHDEGEGHYHGYGLYCFYEPYGCQKRVGTGGVGDKIMKGVLKNKFRDFLIFDGKVAMKYYNSDDIRDQLNYLYDDKEFINEVARIYRDGNYCRGRYGGTQFYPGKGDFKLHFNRDTAYLSKLLWETFGMKLQGGKCRGIVYNGNQDPHACMLFNPKDFIPVCVTRERHLNSSGRDFDNWEIKVTQETIDATNNINDFFSIGEKLKANGVIRSYTKLAPVYGFMRVILKNGRVSFYDTNNKKLVSQYGFDRTLGFTKDNTGTLVSPCYTTIKGRTAELYIVSYEGKYYVCHLDPNTKTYSPIPGWETTEQYDANLARIEKKNSVVNDNPNMENGNEETLNESENFHNYSDPNRISDFREITGLNGNLSSIYHRTDSLKNCESIAKYGFSPQYSSTECYGHGIYATLSPEDSTNHLHYYGNYMIHAYIKDGLKGFVIFNQNIAQKVYGDKWRVSDQLKLLIRPEYYNEMMSRYPYLADDSNIIQTLENELGKTKIRGSIVWYGSCWIAVICDWKCAIPYEYSTDNGYTWTKTLNQENFKYIDNYRDGLFAIQKFIADGIIKNTFGTTGRYRNWKYDINAHPQFVNGYLKVTLASNGKTSFYSAEDDDLISYKGFDTAIAWEKDGEGQPCLHCIIKNTPFIIYKYQGEYVFTIRKKVTDENGEPTIVNQVVKLPNGKIFTTKMYDKMNNI